MVTDTHLLSPSDPHRPGERPSPVVVRLGLTAQAAAHMVVAPVVGTILFSLWVTAAALAPLTVTAPLLLPVTALVRRYAQLRRRAAGIVLGRPLRSPYRPAGGSGLRARVVAILGDRASWRDAPWLLVHAIVGCVVAALPVAFFLGGLFYLAYPLLYALTPQSVFGHPFGGLLVLHSTGQAFVMMPLALLCLAVWWALLVPLARAEARIDRSMLGI